MTAVETQGLHTVAAIIAGQRLQEDRWALDLCQHHLCHSDTNINDNGSDQPFGKWIEENFPFISRRTAYRWLEAAERVMRLLLPAKLRHHPYQIEADGNVSAISDLLTAPESECGPQALKFREKLNEFLKDKTISEAVACVLAGEANESRISRAGNGKIADQAGSGGNRRNYAKFVFFHFGAISTIQKKWDRLIATDPGQHSAMVEAIRTTILGGPYRIPGEKPAPHTAKVNDVKPWSESFSKLMRDVLNERLGKKFQGKD